MVHQHYPSLVLQHHLKVVRLRLLDLFVVHQQLLSQAPVVLHWVSVWKVTNKLISLYKFHELIESVTCCGGSSSCWLTAVAWPSLTVSATWKSPNSPSSPGGVEPLSRRGSLAVSVWSPSLPTSTGVVNMILGVSVAGSPSSSV